MILENKNYELVPKSAKYDHGQAKKDYKVVALKYEYRNYNGEYRFCIYTQLCEEEFTKLYGEEVKSFEPYLIMTWEQYEVRAEFTRNEDKFKKRCERTEGFYGYEDGISECIHSELQVTDIVEKIIMEQEYERLMNAINQLTPTQKRRLLAYFFEKQSARTIAAREGVNHSKVDNSIKAALKKLKKILAQ